MSLILGIHLLERFYLVSDTRLTRENNQTGLITVKDDLIKAFNFNERISSVAAGQALPASFILNKLKEKIDERSTISELKELIKIHLKDVISDYVSFTGYHSGRVVLIITGFNSEKKKNIEASLLGRAMSAMVMSQKGKTVEQSINNKLKQALLSIGGKGKGDYIKVQDILDSEMFTVDLNIRTADWELKDVDCYKYAIFNPEQSIKTVDVPEELLSILEFRARSGSLEDQLYQEAELLINFVNKAIREHKFPSVGGHILPLLVTPYGSVFPTGDFGKIKNGQFVKAGSFLVEDGTMKFELEDGTKGEYRHLESLAKQYAENTEKAYLGETVL